MEEDELTEVKRRIREAEAALNRAEELGNIELILRREDRLYLLLEIEKRLTTGTEIMILIKFNVRLNLNKFELCSRCSGISSCPTTTPDNILQRTVLVQRQFFTSLSFGGKRIPQFRESESRRYWCHRMYPAIPC
jgi:hypothetical protein